MKRLVSLFLAALLAFAPVAEADLRAAFPSQVVRILYKSGVPFISVSSGTMGNNGAITAITALGRTYTRGYMLLPAGAVAAGVPAAATWLFVQCSSTTACTAFNNSYTSGTPTVPASPTAFVTTGPGAFTGVTAETAGPTATVPANAMGANGRLRIWTLWSFTNSAGTKTLRVRYSGASGTQYFNQGATTSASLHHVFDIANAGATNSQISGFGSAQPFSTSSNLVATSAVDTTADTTVVASLQNGAAADNSVLEDMVIELLADGT